MRTPNTTMVAAPPPPPEPTFEDRLAAFLLLRWPDPVGTDIIVKSLFRYAEKPMKGDTKTDVIRAAIEAATPMIVHRLSQSTVTASTIAVGHMFTEILYIARDIDPISRKAAYIDVSRKLAEKHGKIAMHHFDMIPFIAGANAEFRDGRKDLVERCDVDDLRGHSTRGFRVTSHGVNFLLGIGGKK